MQNALKAYSKRIYEKAQRQLSLIEPSKALKLMQRYRSIKRKVKLKDNLPLNDTEFALASGLCDIITEVMRVSEASYPGGIFWGEASTAQAHSIHVRKNRKEIDASMLLNNRFRDFPTIIYEFDDRTPKPDFWIRRYIRLCSGVHKRWHVQIPKRFSELGWEVNGFPVNRHTSFLQERVNAQLCLGMEHALSSSDCPKVLEIGGGSGEMAHTICKNTPAITWYDCDLPTSLIYNAIHMAVWFPDKEHYIYVGNLPVENINETYVLRSAEKAAQLKNAVVNIPYFLLGDFDGKLPVNLALNAWSFSEMPASEVTKYGTFIKNNLLPQGMLIEQNGTHADKGGCNAKEILKHIFPYSRNAAEALRHTGVIAGGAIDAWSLNPIPNAITSVKSSCFHNRNDADDLHYLPVDDYDLLKF